MYEEYDFPSLRTVNGIAEVRDSEGNLFDKGASERIQQMRKVLKRAEALPEELQHDIALCERRMKSSGIKASERSERREAAQARHQRP